MTESKGDTLYTVVLDTGLSEDALNENNKQKEVQALLYAAMVLINALNKHLDRSTEADSSYLFEKVTPGAGINFKTTVNRAALGHIDFNDFTPKVLAGLLPCILSELRDRDKPILGLQVDITTAFLAKQLFFMLHRVYSKTDEQGQNTILNAMCDSLFLPGLQLSRDFIVRQIQEASIRPAPLELPRPPIRLESTHYEHYTTETKEKEKLFSRFHFFHLLNVTSKGLSPCFAPYKGDLLKSKLLEYFKAELEEITDIESLDTWQKALDERPEFKKLNEKQGVYSYLTGKNTSSVDALAKMIDERKVAIEELSPMEPSKKS